MFDYFLIIVSCILVSYKFMFLKSKNLFIIIVIFSVISFSFADAGEVDPDFNPNNILSDEEMLDYQSMTLKDIESFLVSKDGVLKNYACREIKVEKTEETESINNNNETEGGQTCNDYLNPAVHVDPAQSENNSNQVTKLQSFLKSFYSEVQETKLYDQTTINAVKKFQNKYAAEVLTPWGLTSGTGYVGKTTIKKINELYCQKLNKFNSLGVTAESDDNSGDDENEEDENKNTETVWRCFMKSDSLPKKQTDGREWTATEVIYNLAQKYKINPKVILVTLQKEQSLISNPNPLQGLDYALDWAMGYGCLERLKTAERKNLYEGFYNQIDGAYFQFRRYFDYSDSSIYIQKDIIYYGGVGTFGLDDELDVTPANQATAALYSYTPHIFNGNYNFWKFWREYFGEVKGVSSNTNNETLLDPNLLQNPNTPLYYLDNGVKRSLSGLSNKELTELGFDKNRATQVSLKIINSYPTGKKIKYGLESDLLENSVGEIYLIKNGKKRKFYSSKSVKDAGYQLSQIKKGADNQLDYYLMGENMPFPDGTLIKAGGPAVYKIENGERKVFTSLALFKVLGCSWEEIIEVEEVELDNYPNGSNLKYPADSLIRARGQGKVYLVDGSGKAIWIKTAAEFIKNGYDWGEVVEVDEGELELYL